MKAHHYKVMAALIGFIGLLYLAAAHSTTAQQSHTRFNTSEEISQDIPVAFPADI